MRTLNWKILTLLGGVLAMSACQTTKEPSYTVTEIVSEPPGARIEVSGNYLGEAPVKTKIETWPDDGVVKGRVVIRALPVEEGHYVQEKVFQGPHYPFDPNRDKAPSKVFFDMTLEPAAGSVRPGESPPMKKTN